MPDDDITQISLGRFRVGITGLKAAIEELKSWRGRSEEEITQALLARVKPRNYILLLEQLHFGALPGRETAVIRPLQQGAERLASEPLNYNEINDLCR